jgi:hypothetical protein
VRHTPILTLVVTLAACQSGPSAPASGDVGCSGTTYPPWQASAYVLPYPVGVTHSVDLSNCSGSYHSAGLPDEFAIDFAMPIGTVITASRGGTVVQVEESGVDGDFPNNLVVVDHGDGTFAQYMHLTENGALVSIGATVSSGDTLGHSGATGLAGYPHLHFVVSGGDWPWPYGSVPVTFSNTDANPRSLRAGAAYLALPF